MRLPVERNADLKKCQFCSNLIKGVCTEFSDCVADNRYELVEGIVQEALKEMNLSNKIYNKVYPLVAKKNIPLLTEMLDSFEEVLIEDIDDVLCTVLMNRLKVVAELRPDSEFYCKNWR